MWENDDDFGGSEGVFDDEHVDAPVAVGMMQSPSMDAAGGMIGMMVQGAQSLDRSPGRLIKRARHVGSLLGASGFYSFPAGSGKVEGPSIRMAEALAQEWGGTLYQVHVMGSEELASKGRRMHLRASAGDFKTLVCAQVDQVIATSAPPGKFANNEEQRERWHAMQAQSAASKILRNAILRVLPSWFVGPALYEAKAIANTKALGVDGNGNPRTLQQARADALETLKKTGCTQAELEQYVGQPVDLWAVPQISELKALYRAIRSGETSLEAWRASLAPEESTQTTITKSALGLPSSTAATPVTEQMPAEQEKEPVAKGKSKGSNKQASLPGADQ